MTDGLGFTPDEIGPWSEVKLDIIKDYATAYSKILTKQFAHIPRFQHVYVDGFSGAGVHVSRDTKELVPGSPLNALAVDPPFREFHLVDMNRSKAAWLRETAQDNAHVHVYEGDCNKILVEDVLPTIRYDKYRRGLCLLDPYGLHLNWEVMECAGKLGTIDLFLNFPIMDMNMNVLLAHPENAHPDQIARMNAFWGDGSWRDAAYKKQPTLFGDVDKKLRNEDVVEAFRKRLKDVAGFEYVPDPLPMKNTKGPVVYYLFFAAKKAVAAGIVEDIFSKYRT